VSNEETITISLSPEQADMLSDVLQKRFRAANPPVTYKEGLMIVAVCEQVKKQMAVETTK
jgi:hypothetical protein